MSKIYVPLPSEKYIDFYLEQNIDGFFIGIDKYSTNFNNYVPITKLKKIIDYIKNNNKEVFISLNKLYYEKDIDDLKKILKKLSKYDIDGLSFCDVSIYNIVNENKLNINLIWDSFHLGTNFKTINFWNKRDVKSAILSTEITLKEIIEIKKNTTSKIGAVLYGYLNMVTSSRTLISNYFEYTKIKQDKNKYLIEVNDEKYPIVEDNNETNIFSSKVLNGIKIYPKLIENNIDFIILNDYLIEENRFYNVIEAFCALRNAPNDKEFVDKLEKVVNSNTFSDTFDGFFNKKTIYKVKNDE